MKNFDWKAAGIYLGIVVVGCVIGVTAYNYAKDTWFTPKSNASVPTA